MASSALRRVGWKLFRSSSRQPEQIYASARFPASVVRPAVERTLQVVPRRCLLTETPWTFLSGFKFMHRFDERSKIFVIDGNLAVGKTTLGKQLADKLGMKYMKEAHIHYLDELELGEGKKFDKKFMGNVALEDFYNDPFAKDGHSFRFQIMMYSIRYRMYADVMQHLLETGQGIIMDRSVYSDYVFMESMYKMNYFRKECVDFYNEIKGISLYQLRPPHLVIYLDAPVDVIQKRLKDRGREIEQNIPDEYLQHLEDLYKEHFLHNMAETSEILMYDWRNFGDVEQIVEDIDMLEFANSTWKNATNTSLDRMYRFVSNKSKVNRTMEIEKYLPEITIGAHDLDDLVNEYRAIEGNRFRKGYNVSEYKERDVWKLLFK